MNAIEQNKLFQTEFALFLMSDAVAAFWDKYLDNVSTSAQVYEDIEAQHAFQVFKFRAVHFGNDSIAHSFASSFNA